MPGGRSNGQWRLPDITVTDPSVMRRAVAAAAIGNITEWYDFGVYGYLTLTISKVFFTGLPQAVGLIATFGSFAAAFLVRPFGGLVFGPLGDRIGRTKVLSATVILMALGTFCIGVIPGYGTIGVAAPMLLLAARLVQGFSTGGEYGGAMTFIAEYSADRRRGFFGSWLEFGTITGYVFGASLVTVLTAVLSSGQLLSWGWRIPFLVALPLGLVGLFLRLRLEETPAFAKLLGESEKREAQAHGLSEIRDVFVKHWRAVLVCSGIVIVWNVTNYMLTAYIPTYLTATLPAAGYKGTGATTAQVFQIVVLLLLLVVITFIGRLNDRVGRRPVLFVGSGALIVLSVPSVLLMRVDRPWATFLGLLVMGLMLVCFSSTAPSTLPALFRTGMRYGGLAISFNIAVSLFGGTTSTVMQALVKATGDLNWPGYYLIAAGVVGAVATWFVREPKGRSLPGSPPAVADEQEAHELVGASR
ncbi:MAG TPA: MFS transporter [Streptosporangiales bacterium]